jgi:nicotinamidase-related amidase
MERLPNLKGSRPYAWPLSEAWHPANTALLVIDMQRDFLSPEGYFAAMGYSTDAAQAIVPTLQKVVQGLREQGFQIIFTREGHRPDFADLTPMKRQRSANAGAAIGSMGPLGQFLVRGHQGWDLIPEMSPQDADILLDKPGNGAFYGTDLEQILTSRGIKHLILSGVTTDVCVHSTLREANDRGYECLLLSDCCAAGDPELHQAAIKMTLNEGGIFGAVSTSTDLLASVQRIVAGDRYTPTTS